MGHRQPARPAPAREIGQVARGSVINMAAMSGGAILTFALTVLASRWLQPRQAGSFFELIALATILSNTLELGADTGLTRWIAQARALGSLAHIRRLVTLALMPVLLVGVGTAAAVWHAAPGIAQLFLRHMNPGAAAGDIRIVAVIVPVSALSTCAIAGARGFGRMWPYLAVDGFGKPALRLAFVVTALTLGWGMRGAVIGWGLPAAAGLVFALLVLTRLIRSETATWRRAVLGPVGGGRGATQDPEAQRLRGRHRGRPQRQPGADHLPGLRRRHLGAEFWRFSALRGLAGSFQIIVAWLDVLLVGALVNRYAAGLYAAVSKLAVVGTFALEGTRLAIGPQLSALLARQDRRAAAALYQSATRWLMLISWPFYVTMAIFPAVVLGIFGPRYAAAAPALVVLSLVMLLNLGTGNVGVVLLMGGKSSWNVVNAVASLTVNIGLNLLLLPRIGLLGAAIAWAASLAIDNLAAVAEVWWTMRLAPFGPGYWLAGAAAAGCFGTAGMVARGLLGQTLPALAVALGAGLAAYGLVVFAMRKRLQLPAASAMVRLIRRPALGTPVPREVA